MIACAVASVCSRCHTCQVMKRTKKTKYGHHLQLKDMPPMPSHETDKENKIRTPPSAQGDRIRNMGKVVHGSDRSLYD